MLALFSKAVEDAGEAEVVDALYERIACAAVADDDCEFSHASFELESGAGAECVVSIRVQERANEVGLRLWCPTSTAQPARPFNTTTNDDVCVVVVVQRA